MLLFAELHFFNGLETAEPFWLCRFVVPGLIIIGQRARWASILREKSPTNCDAQMSESNFLTRLDNGG